MTEQNRKNRINYQNPNEALPDNRIYIPQAQNYSPSNYFNQLSHYQPICWSGKGNPTFMINKDWAHSFPCIIFLSLTLILVIILGSQAKTYPNDATPKIVFLFNIFILLGIDISYFLTQFLNPGISDPSVIFPPGSNLPKYYCEKCNNYRTKEMNHCQECSVCVEDQDHHCSYFGKCIAGTQRFAFHTFITFVFLSFIGILAGCTIILNPI